MPVCGLFVAVLLGLPSSATEPASVSRCFSSVRVYPETGDTGGYRLHIVLRGAEASGTLEFFEGSSTPTRVQLTGSFKRGSVLLSSDRNALSVPFILSGAPGTRSFKGSIAFDRGALTDTDAINIPSVSLKQCVSTPTP